MSDAPKPTEVEADPDLAAMAKLDLGESPCVRQALLAGVCASAGATADPVGSGIALVAPAHAERVAGPALDGLARHALAGLTAESTCAAALGPKAEAMLVSTSGSTGRPRGVLLRHGSLICNADGVLAHTGIGPTGRLLHGMPLFHTKGITNQFIVPFLAGAEVMLMERFKPEAALGRLRTDGITY